MIPPPPGRGVRAFRARAARARDLRWLAVGVIAASDATATARALAPAAPPPGHPAPTPTPARLPAISSPASDPAPSIPSTSAVGEARAELLRACAPAVDPATLLAVIDVESGGDPFAVHINGGPRVAPQTAAAALAVARAAIAAGYSVDLGLMQVNSRNLGLLKTTAAAMFDPCANVRAGAALLLDGYLAAVRRYGEGQPALRAALSAYNTGDFSRGFANGYVARYFGGPAETPPRAATRAGALAAFAAALDAPSPDAARALPPVDPYTADPTVFTRSTQPTQLARAAEP